MTIRPIAEKKSIDVNSELGQVTALIWVDRTKLIQVLLNVLSNGVKFVEPQGQIWIESVLDSCGNLVISIRDTGMGIAPEYLQKVLEPFEQAEDLFTRE